MCDIIIWLLFTYYFIAFRMLYLARLLQQYIAGAKNDLKKVNEASSPDRDKNKQKSFENSLKKAENILKLAKDLVHTKPTFTPVQPSWKESTLKMAKYVKITDGNGGIKPRLFFII